MALRFLLLGDLWALIHCMPKVPSSGTVVHPTSAAIALALGTLLIAGFWLTGALPMIVGTLIVRRLEALGAELQRLRAANAEEVIIEPISKRYVATFVLQERLWTWCWGCLMKPSRLYLPLLVCSVSIVFATPYLGPLGRSNAAAIAVLGFVYFPLFGGGVIEKIVKWAEARDRVLVFASVIALPPGAGAASVLEFLYSRKTYDSVFAPTIADMQHEHFEALAKGRTAKAFWVRVCGYHALGGAIARETPIVGHILRALGDVLSRLERR